MTNSHSSLLNAEKDQQPLLPLVPIKREYNSDELQSFKLKVNPADPDSATVIVYIPYLTGTEDIRSGLEAIRNLQKVHTGLAAADAAAKDRINMQVLKDEALTAYNSAKNAATAVRAAAASQAILDAGPNPGENAATHQARAAAAAAGVALNDDDTSAGLRNVITYLCPTRALPRIKRYLRRKCRKPIDMKVKEFHTHFMRINNQELPNLPPLFHASQSLSNDELIDIVLYAVPNKWQVELQRKGIDPYTLATSYELIRHLENIEAAEELEKSSNKTVVSKKDNKKKSAKKQKTFSGKDNDNGEFHCMYHGDNNTHSTENCYVLKKMIGSVDKDKKKKGDKKSSNKSSNNSFKKKSSNKGENFALSKKADTMRDEIAALESKKRKLEQDIESAEQYHLDQLDAVNFDDDISEKTDPDQLHMVAEEEAEA